MTKLVEDRNKELEDEVAPLIDDLLEKAFEKRDYNSMEETLQLRTRYRTALRLVLEKWDDEANPLN